MTKFPYPLEESLGAKALDRWRELREIGKTQGFYPIIVGDADDVDNLSESFAMNSTGSSEIIRIAGDMTAEEILRHRAEQDPELTDDVEEGEWPDEPVHQPVVSHTDLGTGKPKAKVFIAKIPTKQSYEVPAFLKYGGWNDCPSAEEHVALHKMWSERYGSEIVAVTPDVIECIVSRPPKSREESMILAKQQFYYCTDIVYQGVETLSALAGGLKDHNVWFFWWD